MNYVHPYDRATAEERDAGLRWFFPSSRIKAMVNGSSKSVGASCNVFHARDNLTSIGAAMGWSYSVLGYQGAPAVYLDLREEGAPVSTGGSSSGVVAFAHDFDSIVSHMRRPEKKNGAGSVYIRHDHPDLDKFSKADFKAAYKAVYVPANGTPEMDKLLKSRKLLNKLAKDYDNYRYFIVKKPKPTKDGEDLFTNLCTEVEIPHQGTCILGAVNLAYYGTLDEFYHAFPVDFRNSALEMLEYKQQSELALRQSPLWCYSPANNQFGLGLFGLASLLAQLNIKYAELADVFNSIADVEGDVLALERHLSKLQQDSPAHFFVYVLYRAYASATLAIRDKVRAAFCFQPTVSTSQKAFAASGHNVTPELQPAIGLPHEDAVSTIIKSAIKGDRQLDFHPDTETIYSVPYNVYLSVARGFQQLIDCTGLAHRHSLCYYGDKFTTANLVDFLTGREKSLYYRLPNKVNIESLRKDSLWEDTNDIIDADFDIESIGKQLPGTIECDCAM